MIPRELYKYVSGDRVDILINGHIRFTQPSAWNDPFELQPYYEDHVPKNPSFALSQLGKLIKQIQETNEIPEKEIEEYERERKRITKEDVYSFIHRNIIGLSLTEDKENLLMWAHYAANHSGFVIEFNTNNNFFQDDSKYLFKVTCDKSRPNVKTNEFASLIINLVELIKENKKIPKKYFDEISKVFRKSTNWEYEKEWRLITTTDKSQNYNEFKDEMNVIHLGKDSELNRDFVGNDYIALLDIPISSIKTIYCGKRMKQSNIRKLFLLTKFNQHYSQIKLLRAEIDEKSYKLNFKEVTDFDVLKVAEFEYEQNKNKKSLKNKLDPFLRKYEKEIKKYKKIKPAGNNKVQM